MSRNFKIFRNFFKKTIFEVEKLLKICYEIKYFLKIKFEEKKNKENISNNNYLRFYYLSFYKMILIFFNYLKENFKNLNMNQKFYCFQENIDILDLKPFISL